MKEQPENNINPQLESLLKQELANRAEKLQKMDSWKKEEKSTARIFRMPAAITSIAAILIVGFFLFNNFNTTENPSFDTESVYRGQLINPEIYKALDDGDMVKAEKLITAERIDCELQLKQLQSTKISPDLREEANDRILQLQQELSEIDSLENSIKK